MQDAYKKDSMFCIDKRCRAGLQSLLSLELIRVGRFQIQLKSPGTLFKCSKTKKIVLYSLLFIPENNLCRHFDLVNTVILHHAQCLNP